MFASNPSSPVPVEINANVLSIGLSLSMMCAPVFKLLEACVTRLYHRLYGIATLQVFLYYTVYGKNDNHLNKGFVSVVDHLSSGDSNVYAGAICLVLRTLVGALNHIKLIALSQAIGHFTLGDQLFCFVSIHKRQHSKSYQSVWVPGGCKSHFTTNQKHIPHTSCFQGCHNG